MLNLVWGSLPVHFILNQYEVASLSTSLFSTWNEFVSLSNVYSTHYESASLSIFNSTQLEQAPLSTWYWTSMK